MLIVSGRVAVWRGSPRWPGFLQYATHTCSPLTLFLTTESAIRGVIGTGILPFSLAGSRIYCAATLRSRLLAAAPFNFPRPPLAVRQTPFANRFRPTRITGKLAAGFCLGRETRATVLAHASRVLRFFSVSMFSTDPRFQIHDSERQPHRLLLCCITDRRPRPL